MSGGPARATALRVGPRAAAVLVLASVIGLGMFCWPLLSPPQPQAIAHSGQAPLMFVLLLPVILAVVLAEISEGGIDPKTLALLGCSPPSTRRCGHWGPGPPASRRCSSC